MTTKELDLIKKVRTNVNQGAFNPIELNAAYALLSSNEAPQRIKMQTIERFMVFNYEEELLNVKSEKIDVKIPTISTGNPEDYSHQESQTIDPKEDIQGFITADEQEVLRSEESGTELVIDRRKRSPNGQHQPRKK
jgi:hypothetical protein